jgi:hypothetical protein
MSDRPTFGRYAEIPVDAMTLEQREGYRYTAVSLTMNFYAVPAGTPGLAR